MIIVPFQDNPDMRSLLLGAVCQGVITLSLKDQSDRVCSVTVYKSKTLPYLIQCGTCLTRDKREMGTGDSLTCGEDVELSLFIFYSLFQVVRLLVPGNLKESTSIPDKPRILSQWHQLFTQKRGVLQLPIFHLMSFYRSDGLCANSSVFKQQASQLIILKDCAKFHIQLSCG